MFSFNVKVTRLMMFYFWYVFQHILFNHTPWFIKQYGFLSIWSTQGMEKSHYQARTRYFKHTRHGGGRQRANSLLEVFQWFYRQIWQKYKLQNSLESQENMTLRALQYCSRNREHA